MATVTRPAVPLPNPGDDIDAEQVRDWINNLLSFIESTNIDEANVDLTGEDGIVGKSTSQVITGLKTFESNAAAAGGVREVLQLGIDPSSGTAADNDGGRITFYADDDAGTETDIASLDWVLSDATNASEDSRVEFKALLGGALGTVYSGGYSNAAAGSHTFTVRDTAAASTLDAFVFQWDPDSGTALDNQGVALAFKMADDAGVQTNFATIDVVATDVSDTSEDSKFVFNVLSGGSESAALTVDASTVAVAGNLTVGGTLTLTGGLTLNGNVTVGDSASDTLTINSTITSNLLFTDATYDIGASGATRPRDLFLSRNAVMGGTLGVTGLITATGGVSGALTGNVTGNLTGNVTGNVTGNLTGDVTGNISGNVTGGTISGTTGTFSGVTTVGSAGATADFAVWTDGTSSTAAGFTVDASADEVIVGQLSGGGNTNFKVRNRLNNTVFQVTPDAPSTTVFAPNIATGSAGTLTVKTGSINSDSIRLEAGGTTSTWLESRGYLGHSWYVDATRSMTLDSTGLGVGTDSPTRLLHLSSTGGTFARFTSENTDDFSVGANANGFVVYNETDADYPFVITNTGNVGINTVSPQRPLHIDGTEGVARFTSTASGNNGLEVGIGTSSQAFIWQAENSYLQFATNNVERLHIDASGNMGLGVTPSAWLSTIKALQVGDGASVYNAGGAGGDVYYNNNWYINSSSQNIYLNNGYALSYGQAGGEHRWFTAPSGTAGNTVSFTQAMTLTNAGLLGLGTASPSGVIHADAASGVDGPVFDSGGTGNTNHALLVRDSGNNQLFRVNNNGKVGINTSSPVAMLDINGLGRSTAVTGVPATGTGAEFFIDSGAAYFQGYNRTGSAFIETRFRGNPIVLEGGSVGIGTGSPQAPLHIIGGDGDPSAAHSGGAQLILENNGQTFLEIATGTTHYSAITFSDDVASRGAVIYDHGTALGGGADSLHIQTAGSQKAVINASGDFGLGTTSPSYKTEIAAGASTEGLAVTASSGDVYLQTDGQVYGYQKLDVATAGLQLKGFSNGGGTKTEQARMYLTQDAAGSAGGEFRLYLNNGTSVVERLRVLKEGGITFNGDTAAANALDDYEEGTWTPTIDGFTGTYGQNSGTYVKIGQLVHASCYITLSSITSMDGTQLDVSGFPFAAENSTSVFYAGNFGNFGFLDLPTGTVDVAWNIGNGLTYSTCRAMKDNANYENVLNTAITSTSFFMYVSWTYRTA